jgi:transcriptional regulator with XRE-family HTH domain
MSEPRLSVILKREMERLGLNPHSLALAAGLHKDAVRNVMRGKSDSPRGKTIQAIASYLGVSVAYLLGQEPVDMPSKTRRAGQVPGPEERAELLKLWDGLDAEARKMLIFVARGIAREAAASSTEIRSGEDQAE